LAVLTVCRRRAPPKKELELKGRWLPEQLMWFSKKLFFPFPALGLGAADEAVSRIGMKWRRTGAYMLRAGRAQVIIVRFALCS
jgi:hypothetical protein